MSPRQRNLKRPRQSSQAWRVVRHETGAPGKEEMKPRLLFPEKERLGLLGALFDLELAQNGMPADVDFVPLAFDAAQGTFAHFAQVTERRRVADKGMNFLLAGRGDFDGRVNHFQLLHDDALEFEKMIFFRRPVFFGAGRIDEMIELLPAFDMGLDLGDQLAEFFRGHRLSGWLGTVGTVWGERKITAPPRISRAVMRRLAKWMLNSASGICASRAWWNRSSTSRTMSRNNPCGYPEAMVDVTTLPSRLTVKLPAGSC